MYAIINDNGRQQKVSEGDCIAIDRPGLKAGESVEFTDVLLVADGEKRFIGAPGVAGAKVVAEVKGAVTGAKTFATIYRRVKNSRRKVGGRQEYTEVVIKSIVAPQG